MSIVNNVLTLCSKTNLEGGKKYLNKLLRFQEKLTREEFLMLTPQVNNVNIRKEQIPC